ncbi:2-amino-4-hydroxy-6-hydroxymethyldihydropteridine diphosphokinase [Pontibacter akesuensis]|uniref:2-amino-4-hydroxy-6-hydroxymethyldihydropteridine pyrophosphokinase n=1 Tax=Pontibacter akesuensis TaxID=388950 RepID=A0A1I7GWQ6_9BACT|nr:2-amino-4-hydroxy-6-hydroxymethyldihydropteridine diphosphokinase [Pontibacter akesuensis]GHA54714.1 2-amino-4-hydroxy-6-hydroxymethyldihydropteridine diphosphokinase [Pontibacter akesuensis]SFU52859.1 2-amino-4-hydroxy-6-hydroxymethyldihydropteridinediphosphokinase [Pontibacter akesuensis]
MPKLYLLLGGNLGERTSYLQQARESIAAQVGGIQHCSKIYETAAWGKTDQPSFLNQVLEVKTTLAPEQVLQHINNIEQELGRVRLEHWGSRVIDIDILFYDSLVLQTQRLTIPHPQLHKRRFTLLPLAEIAPELVHPVLETSIKQLLQECSDTLEVWEYKV